MKILYLTILLILMTGCITMNPCTYCHEKKVPDYIRHVDKDMGDGITKEIKWYGWIHYSKRIPQPDKNIDIIMDDE